MLAPNLNTSPSRNSCFSCVHDDPSNSYVPVTVPLALLYVCDDDDDERNKTKERMKKI